MNHKQRCNLLWGMAQDIQLGSARVFDALQAFKNRRSVEREQELLAEFQHTGKAVADAIFLLTAMDEGADE